MNPASGEYFFGLPMVDKAEIRLPGSRSFVVETISAGGKRSRILKAELNGKEIPVFSLRHEQLLKGGRLVLELD